MKFTLNRDPKQISALFKEQLRSYDTIAFICECDDERLLVVSGLYFEKFDLPEILRRIAAELPAASYAEIKNEL
jgi:hypothetical protein